MSKSTRPLSRDVNHVRQDLAASLAFALGPDAPAAETDTAERIIASVASWGDSQQCLLDVRTVLGVRTFGLVTLFHLTGNTSLRGQSEVFTTRRALGQMGLAVRDLGWPASQLNDVFAADAVDTPGLEERLEAAVTAWTMRTGG